MRRIEQLVLYNGVIQTMDSSCRVEDAILIEGGVISALGHREDLFRLAPQAEKIDLEGNALYPGFIDTHSHLSLFSLYADEVYCGAEVGTLEGALARLRQRAKERPGERILGWGFDDSILPENRGPSIEELDAISTEVPIIVIHISAHASYVNSKALNEAGLSAASEFDGGSVVVDENGKPTGQLLEHASFQAMDRLSPPPSRQKFHNALIEGIKQYNSYGITSTHEAGVGMGGITAPLYTTLLQQMERNGELNIRCCLSYLDEEFEKFRYLGVGSGFGTNQVRISGPKLFNDGSIQAHTAALLSPYYDTGEQPGLFMSQDLLNAKIESYHRDGFQIAFHANGDACAESMIVAVEKAQEKYPRNVPRHIMIHAQTVSDSQLERMKRVGIVPSFYGLHVFYYGDRHYRYYLGPERANRLDPSGSAVRFGMRHSLHADSPVMPPWTLLSIHTAVNRVTRDGRVLGDDQKISVEEAVRAYTTHAAWFQFREEEIGSLETGKKADMVLLSSDLLTMDSTKIKETKVLKTFLEGRLVFAA